MPTRLHKNRKKRGAVSAGHGRIGKHRKHPSGRGHCGGLTHHRILFDKYHPGHFGKIGQRHLHFRKNKVFNPVANIQNVWPIALKAGVKLEKREDNKVPIIDLTKAGIFKCLGKGRLPAVPLIVKAKFFSKRAEEKIKKAGGVCVLTA